MSVKLYEVGGCIRDEIMGLPVHDVDFSVEADSYAEMREYLVANGFDIFVEHEEYLTIRARPPKDSALYQRTRGADFVLCRKDSTGSDGRRPDYVEVGTIYDDLARRDFTVNAIARNIETGEIIDPHGGREDIEDGLLQFVGDPMDRIVHDGLRVIRGFRFMVTKDLIPVPATQEALESPDAATCLERVDIERVSQELAKMFAFDTLASIEILNCAPKHTSLAIFRDGLRLAPSLKHVKGESKTENYNEYDWSDPGKRPHYARDWDNNQASEWKL